MIGGTGLLGSEGARELIRRGHKVLSMALPPIPSGSNLPPEMELILGNYLECSDDEICGYMRGCQGFVFAAGVDERVVGPPPIYDLFDKYNIQPLKRLLTIAKSCGVKHAVILGSYFAYFHHLYPQLELTKYHPYIRSRIDQESLALSFADDSFDVSVLELPYIFGTQPGRKPVWTFLVEQIRKMKGVTLYPKGGTAMVTIAQVGQCIAGALERSHGGTLYPVGYDNLTWVELLRIVHKYMGMPQRRIITIPTFLFRINAKNIIKQQAAAGHEGGLNMVEFTKLMTVNLFIDKKTIVEELGVQPDDIDRAIGDSVKLCLAILDGRVNAIEMKGE
jgi:dihydroflavonol-4-reductase